MESPLFEYNDNVHNNVFNDDINAFIGVFNPDGVPDNISEIMGGFNTGGFNHENNPPQPSPNFIPEDFFGPPSPKRPRLVEIAYPVARKKAKTAKKGSKAGKKGKKGKKKKSPNPPNLLNPPNPLTPLNPLIRKSKRKSAECLKFDMMDVFRFACKHKRGEHMWYRFGYFSPVTEEQRELRDKMDVLVRSLPEFSRVDRAFALHGMHSGKIYLESTAVTENGVRCAYGLSLGGATNWKSPDLVAFRSAVDSLRVEEEYDMKVTARRILN